VPASIQKISHSWVGFGLNQIVNIAILFDPKFLIFTRH